MLRSLPSLGSLASRLVLAVLALLLGWLAPLHAGGPSPVATDEAPIQLPTVALRPVVQIFLAAYRGQGPPVLVLVPIGGGPVFAVGVDALYSPQAVTNEAGQVVERYSYTAFGERTVLGGYSSSTSRIGFNHGFTGLRDEGGLLFARNRYFSPELGRWISRDPAGYVDGYSLYNGYFVPNRLDPEGKFWIGMAIAGAITAVFDATYQYYSNPNHEINWLRVATSGMMGATGFGLLGRVGALYGAMAQAYATAGLGVVGGTLAANSIYNNLNGPNPNYYTAVLDATAFAGLISIPQMAKLFPRWRKAESGPVRGPCKDFDADEVTTHIIGNAQKEKVFGHEVDVYHGVVSGKQSKVVLSGGGGHDIPYSLSGFKAATDRVGGLTLMTRNGLTVWVDNSGTFGGVSKTSIDTISASLRTKFGGEVRYFERWQDAARAIALWRTGP